DGLCSAPRRPAHPPRARAGAGHRLGGPPDLGGGAARVSFTAYARTAFAQAASAVRSAPLLPAVSVLSIALGLVVTGAGYVAARNLATLLEAWGEGVQITIYFDPAEPP